MHTVYWKHWMVLIKSKMCWNKKIQIKMFWYIYYLAWNRCGNNRDLNCPDILEKIQIAKSIFVLFCLLLSKGRSKCMYCLSSSQSYFERAWTSNLTSSKIPFHHLIKSPITTSKIKLNHFINSLSLHWKSLHQKQLCK